MASVKKFPASRFWYACYKMPTGQLDGKGRMTYSRRQRSTGTADESRALQMAISFERAAVMAGERRWIEGAARQFLGELQAITGSQVALIEPAGAFLKRWLASRKSALAPGSFDRYAGQIDDFLTYLGPASTAPLSSLSALTLARFRDAEHAAGKSAGTVNKALMVLAQAFDEAVTLGAMERNIARGLNLKRAKSAKRHRRQFTFEQFRALAAATTDDWRTLILLAGYTGGRQQELCQLRWSQLDLPGARLCLTRTKTADQHWLPLHPSLSAYLRKLRPAPRRTGPLLPYLSTLQRRSVSNYFRRDILPLIGLDQPFSAAEGRGKGRVPAEYSLHSFRHSLATWLDAAGVPEAVRMRLIGHADKTIHRDYTHPDFSADGVALARVPAL